MQDMIAHVLTTLLQDPYMVQRPHICTFMAWLAEVNTDYPKQNSALLQCFMFVLANAVQVLISDDDDDDQ